MKMQMSKKKKEHSRPIIHKKHHMQLDDETN